MIDTRQPLPVGTKIRFDSGSIFEIASRPTGLGGGSIIYPALRYSMINGVETPDGFDYVVKECFPVSGEHRFLRSDSGEVVAENTEGEGYLQLCKERQLREEAVTKKLYKTAIHTLPIKEASPHAMCRLPGCEEQSISNTFTVMDSLSLKGTALSAYVKNRKTVPLRQSFSILRQLLSALKETHSAGFLHLDIQTGNIYIQGSLSSGESVLTLIDFGCARPLIEGHTEPIADRMVFTTQGFAAPEIILHNDGSLVLGPEADIYSAGCVLLNLLTGKRYSSSELISNRTGRYIDAMKLHRISCPRHLSDKLQQIIAKALKNEPAERYGSAEEMLADVDSFISALPAAVSPLANTDFDAFISYRHGEIDSPAALELQKRLEHFRAPRGTAAQRRPFRRCFVDEGELSSGYDYAGQLREVLKNSGWLIVICSPGTGTSRWVNEEIDIFLEYHDRSRVLALLTGGEPAESFPPRLLEEAPGGDLLIAADARGDTLNSVLKNIRGDALLKLAAPMLQTTFEGLRQRDKIYKLRRFTAAAALAAVASVAFGIYAADKAATISAQAQRIEEEYRASLLNESLFLIEQAEKRLDEDDTMGAIEMALKALPSEKQDRPVAAGAKYILQQAIGTYVMPGNEKVFKAAGQYDTGSSFKMFTDNARQLIFTLEDENRKICVRDKDYELINAVNFTDDVNELSFKEDFLDTDRGVLYVRTDKGLFKWSYGSNELVKLLDIFPSDFVLSPDGSIYAAIVCDSDDMRDYISVFDVDTGKLISQHTYADGPAYYSGLCRITPDNRQLIISSSESLLYASSSESQRRLFSMSLDTGEFRELFSVPYYVSEIAFIGKYIACYSAAVDVWSLSDEKYNGTTLYSSLPVMLYIYDMEKNSMVCALEEYACSDGYTCSIKSVNYNGASDAVIFSFENRCEIVELSSGRVLEKYHFGAPVLDLLYSDSSISAYTVDGCIYSARFGTDNVVKFDCFCHELKTVCAAVGSEYVYVQTDSEVIKYARGSSDEGYTPISIDASEELSYSDRFLFEAGSGGKHFFVLGEDCLYAADIETGICSKTVMPFTTRFNYDNSYTLLGCSDDGRSLYIREGSFISSYDYTDHPPEECKYYIVSPADKRVTAAGCAEPIWSETDGCVEDSAFFRGKMYYAVSDYNKGSISLYSWIPGEEAVELIASYTPEKGALYFPFSLKVSDSAVTFALKSEGGACCILAAYDTVSRSFISVSDKLYDGAGCNTSEFVRSAYCWDSGNRRAVYALNTTMSDDSVEQRMYLVNENGEHFRLEDSGQEVCLAVFTPDSRLIVAGTEHITEYSDKGEIVSRLSLSDIYSYSYNPTAYCEFIGDSGMVISYKGVEFILELSNGLAMEACVPYGVGFDSDRDRIIVYNPYPSEGKSPIGSFHRYSTEELVRLGEGLLQK